MSTKAFQAMRFNILVAALSPATRDKIPDDYAFAWDHAVYPIYTQNEIVEAFEDDFKVSKDMMGELLKKLDQHWDHGNGPGITFYELEDHFKVSMGLTDWDATDWDRPKLIFAMTYLYLHYRESRIFDQELFDSIVRDSGAPTEANGYMMPFNRDKDICLI